MRSGPTLAAALCALLGTGAAPAQEAADPEVPGTPETPVAQEPPAPGAAATRPLPATERLRALPGLAAARPEVREAAIVLLTTPLELQRLLATAPGTRDDAAEAGAALATLADRARRAPDPELPAALAELRAAQLRALDPAPDPRARAVLAAEIAALAELRPARDDGDPTLPEALDQALARGAPGPGAEEALRALHRLGRARQTRRAADPASILFAPVPEGDAGAALRHRWEQRVRQLREALQARAAASVELGAALDRRNRLLLAIEPELLAAHAQRELLDRLVPAGLGAPLGDGELAESLARLDALEQRLAPIAARAADADHVLAPALAGSLEAVGAAREAHDAAREIWGEAWSAIDAVLGDVARARAALWASLAGAAPAEPPDEPLVAALARALRERARRCARDAPGDPDDTGDADEGREQRPAGVADAPWSLRVLAATWLHEALDEIGSGELLERHVAIALGPATAPSERGLALLALGDALQLPWRTRVARGSIDVELSIGGRAFVMRDVAQLGPLALPRVAGSGSAPVDATHHAPSLAALRATAPLLAGEVPDARLVVDAIEAAVLAAPAAEVDGSPADAAQSSAPQALQ